MKFFNGLVDFSYSWSDVAAALWQRYPNPFSKHVLSEDVLERYVKDGKLHTVKLLTKTNSLPRWGERFYKGPKFITIIEESIVDPTTKTFITYSRNITMSHFMSCTEKCVYKAMPDDPNKTSIQKSAWLDSSMGYGLRIPILEFSINRYKSNQQKATKGLEYAITHHLPLTLREIVKQKTERFAESANNSKEMLSQRAKKASELARSKAEQAKTRADQLAESAKNSKEMLSQKAKKASELARSKAEQAKSKAELSRNKVSE